MGYKHKHLFLYSFFLLSFNFLTGINIYSETVFYIGRLHYHSGGDWYSNPSSLPNLSKFCSKLNYIKYAYREKVVTLKNDSFKAVPIIYFTGHGKFELSPLERKNLRWYLKNGGFLFADDNYGMDKFIRKELNQLIEGVNLQEIPTSHPIFKKPFLFKYGLPKIHKHYGGRSVAYGLFLKQKLVAFYGYNTDLGDGWEDLNIHNDGPLKHEQALQMGCNVLNYALSQGIYEE